MQFLERRHAVERERARIARDIHDELGAGLTQIGLLADLGLSQTADPEQKQTSFSKIGGRARAAAGALDEIVWAADPRMAICGAWRTTFASSRMTALSPHPSGAAKKCRWGCLPCESAPNCVTSLRLR